MQSQHDTDHYAAIIAAMQPGLLVSVNQLTPNSVETDELRVVSVRADVPEANLLSPVDTHMRLAMNPEGTPVLEEVDSEGYSVREMEVETIEIHGIRRNR